MSASASQSKSDTTNTSQQLSTQGASAAESPTVTAGGAVTIENAGGKVSLQALSGMEDVVKAALDNQGNLNAQQINLLSNLAGKSLENSAATTSQNSDLLSGVLQANQQLAQNSQSGGATAAIKQSNYLIWGLLGLAAVLVFSLFRNK